MMNFVKLAGITGLTALTAMASLGLGTVNVLADDAQLPAYVMDGTNAERAVSDFFVNSVGKNNENSVTIPHMDIMMVQDNDSTVDVYGSYRVIEYVQNGNVLTEDGVMAASQGHFTLNKNADGTYTVANYNEIPDDASKENFVEVFGKGLADEAFDIYCENDADLWQSIMSEDVAYYSFDNELGLGKIADRTGDAFDVATVSFSKEGTHTMYVQTDANVRTAGTTQAMAFEGLPEGEAVQVTGMANGWSRVTVNGRTGYMAASLLDESKPAEEKKAEKKDEKKDEQKAEKKDEQNTEKKVYQAADGRVVDMGDHNGLVNTENTEKEVYQAADGRVVDMGDHNGLVNTENTEKEVYQAADGRVVYTGSYDNDEESEQTAEDEVYVEIDE